MTAIEIKVCLLALLLISFIKPAIPQSVQETEARLLERAEENIEKFRKGDVVVQFRTEDQKILGNAEVEVVQQTHDFLFGCIIFDLIWNEEVYGEELFKRRFKKIFNLAVFPFYWPAYESNQGMPEWENMLPVIEWCQANEITTKGHPLVWPCRTGTPQWLANYTVEEMDALLKSRVINITAGFKDKIELWDVVNEPVNLKTWENKAKNLADDNDWGLTEPIPEITDYVEKALQWAHFGNPEATLMINEYRTIVDKEVRQRYYELLKDLKSHRAPISHMGIQAHEPRQEWFPPEDVWETFNLYADLGYTIHITELHPQSSGVEITGGWRTGNWTPEAQAEFTEQFVTLCFGHPSVSSINWWGFSDRNIWLPGGGLVDEEYRPKPVYELLDQLINEKWRTNLSTTTNGEGEIAFRGFYGQYEIKLLTTDGRILTFPIHVRKNGENIFVFTI